MNAGYVYAAFSKDDAGTTGAGFLKLGAGARAAAMGGSFAGVSGSPDNLRGVMDINFPIDDDANVGAGAEYDSWIIDRLSYGTASIVAFSRLL